MSTSLFQTVPAHKPSLFKPSVLCLALLSALGSHSAHAADVAVETEAQVSAELKEVVVKGKKQPSRKDNEVTGLGKIVKTTNQLNKEQILNIRDLTRYDPGISVVEQGRGASSGYSIRGMDKNRVGLLVDGLPQIQSYSNSRSNNRSGRTDSGAINEIEYENIRAVEISKGASSSEYGNGSLGGALSFRTKEPDDIIKPGQNWGLDTKNAYSSKNGQLTNSIAAAGRINGFEALAVYTHRDGHETEVHKDAGRLTQTIDKVKINAGSQYGWIDTGKCPSADASCIQPYYSIDHTPGSSVTETVSAKEYTGRDRILPDPMDYKSDSWLLKGGYRISPRHYIGGVYERTKQRYDTRDMTWAKYWSLSEPEIADPDGVSLLGRAIDGDILAGLTVPFTGPGNLPAEGSFPAGPFPTGKSIKYSRTYFIDERHHKDRSGLNYRYTNPDKNSWADEFTLSYDRQNIGLDTRYHNHNCAVYPAVDKNCRASADKPFSFYETGRSRYGEKHNLFQIKWNKTFQAAFTRHNLTVGGGYDKFSSTLQESDYQREMSSVYWSEPGRAILNGKVTELRSMIGTRYHHQDLCRLYKDYCEERIITGKNHYFSLQDQMSLGQYVDLGLGGRYDRFTTHSDDSWTSSGKLSRFSWNAGIVVKPTDHLSVSYRASTGFRMPSFREMFGPRIPGYSKDDPSNDRTMQAAKAEYKPEKAFNQEVGLGYKGDIGQLEISYFRNRYRDLIVFSQLRRQYSQPSVLSIGGYHGIQDVDLSGINIVGKIYWDGISKHLPEGLYSTVAYNKIKPTHFATDPRYTDVSSPMLDALQPKRIVLSLGYDHPEGKWGINSTMTYSAAKDTNGLYAEKRSGSAIREDTAVSKVTKRWYTYDISGYVTLKKHFTLRAGIYNLLNRRYSTWEAVRQTAQNAVNRHTGNSETSYSRYAAPGRNYALTLEMKF